jgi:hypothetical protein
VCRAAHRSRLFELCRPGLYYPGSWQQEAIADLVKAGELVDSGQRRRGRSGKWQIVWITKEHVGRA